MGGETVVVASNGGVTRPTLKRPHKPNAFTVAMHAQPRAALDLAADHSQCRVVVLTGTDRPFCAGQDLTCPGTEGDLADAGSCVEQAYNPLVKLIASLETPTVCAVNGIAAFTRIGLIPDASSTWTLPRLVGPARAQGLTMLAGRPSAEMDLARELPRKAVALADAGIGAVREKRAPKFTGRSR
jgi:2-(1,2-epoxy-1,2-dihydrophenyl)acetyl-CoA isomerase